MRKLFNSASLYSFIGAGLLSLSASFNAFATYSYGGHSYGGSSGGSSWGGFSVAEGENFDVYYRAGSAYGAPVVSGDNILFFPEDMSVSGRRWASDTWTTTVLIKPKDGFDVSTLDYVEWGDYSYTQGSEDNQGIFDVNARLFINDKHNLWNYDFLKLDETVTANQDVDLEEWSVSDSFDISDFANGFFLTIQNTLTVKSKVRTPVPSGDESDWLGQWKDKSGSMAEYLANCNVDYKKFKKHWYDWKRLRYGDHENGDRLFMQKKVIGIGLGGAPEVPVPASAWLFGSALGIVTVIRRRKN